MSPGEPVITALGPADLDEVHALEQRAQRYPWSAGQIAEELAPRDDRAALGTRAAGALVGWLALRRLHDEAWVLQLGVAPASRRGGLGGRLVEAAAERAGVWRCDLWLEVRESNRPARALYARTGFVEQGRRPGYYPVEGGGREAAVLLNRALGAAR